MYKMGDGEAIGVTVLVSAVVICLALAPLWWLTKMEHNESKKPAYRCIEGYKFTKDGKKQIINENGNGIPCSDNFVLPNTLGVR